MDIERILVPIDFSEPSLAVLDDAVEFSRPYEARLTILYVVEGGSSASPLLVDGTALGEREKTAAEKKLARLAEQIAKRGIECITLLRFGVAHAEILATAKRIKANLIIMSTHGRTGLAHVLIGSVAERVVREATCPVMTIRTAERSRSGGRSGPGR
ncbi:MAG TPA: universal stress protein [Candidatus Binataceae bacterium]|nr:universal stress protein [Candidatus Binataceae bacterium]